MIKIDPSKLPDPREKIRSQIDALERAEMLPRVTREFLLLQAEDFAEKQGVEPSTLPAYVKLKALDCKIAELRGSL